MTPRIPTPRLLPLTICLLGAVLAVKSTSLLQLAIVAYEPATLFTTALAAGPETPAQAGNTQEQPGNTSAQPGNPSAKPGRQSADAKPAAGNANPADMPPALNEARRSPTPNARCCWNCATGGANSTPARRA
jgi:hypothetical protein